MLFIVTRDLCEVEIPAPVSLAGVHQRAAILSPAHAPLHARGVGDTAGVAILYIAHVDISVVLKGHLLAIGRYYPAVRAAGERPVHRVHLVVRPVDIYLQHIGLLPWGLGVDLPVEGVAQHPAPGGRQVAHGQLGECGDCLGIGPVGQGGLIHVERAAIALAQEVESLAAGGEHRVAILAVTCH